MTVLQTDYTLWLSLCLDCGYVNVVTVRNNSYRTFEVSGLEHLIEDAYLNGGEKYQAQQ